MPTEGASDAQQRLRRAPTVVISFDEGSYRLRNYLVRRALTCSEKVLSLLRLLDNWTARDQALEWARMCGLAAEPNIEALIKSGMLVEEGTSQAALYDRYQQAWKWDDIAAAYHFGIKDAQFEGDDSAVSELMRSRLQTKGAPISFTDNDDSPSVVTLPAVDPDDSLNATMARRRSSRTFSGASISLLDLATVLFAGLGITGYVEHPDLGRLPLKTTPSGGARNPFEAYVLVNRVEGAASGVYHYSARQRTLAPLPAGLPPNTTPGDLLAGQDWVNSASAVILLVANFDRTMWKYEHPNGYRVVMIEAGHIAQNMVLAATHRGFASAVTAAIAHSLTQDCLGVTALTQAVTYAIVVGVAEPVDIHSATPILPEGIPAL